MIESELQCADCPPRESGVCFKCLNEKRARLGARPLTPQEFEIIEKEPEYSGPNACTDCARVGVHTVLQTKAVRKEGGGFSLVEKPCPECASRLDAVVHLTHSITSTVNLMSSHLLNTIKVLTIKHLDETAKRQLKDAITDLKLLVDEQLLRLE